MHLLDSSTSDSFSELEKSSLYSILRFFDLFPDVQGLGAKVLLFFVLFWHSLIDFSVCLFIFLCLFSWSIIFSSRSTSSSVIHLGVVNRYNVCSLACKVCDNTLTPANIKKAFCKSGIFPLDKTAISDSQVAPATSFVEETVSQVAPTTSFDKEAVSLDCAESFLLKRGGEFLKMFRDTK